MENSYFEYNNLPIVSTNKIWHVMFAFSFHGEICIANLDMVSRIPKFNVVDALLSANKLLTFYPTLILGSNGVFKNFQDYFLEIRDGKPWYRILTGESSLIISANQLKSYLVSIRLLDFYVKFVGDKLS